MDDCNLDKSNIEKCRDILSKEIGVLKTNLQLLRDILELHQRNNSIFNKYFNFFIYLILTLLLSSLLTIRKIFDKRKDVYSLYYLLEEAKKTYSENSKRLDELKKSIEEYEDKNIILEYVNKIIAHLDIKEQLSILDFLTKINPSEILKKLNRILDFIEKIFNEILRTIQYFIDFSPYKISKEVKTNPNIATMHIDKIWGIEEDFERMVKDLENRTN